MVKFSKRLLKDAGIGINKTLMEILVCPLSKQPLRYCEETNSIVSDALGVSYPVKNGIPCLVPREAKILDADDGPKTDESNDTAKKE